MHDEDGMPHDHVMEILDSDLAEDIEGIERFTLYSVGIDIGSSTTHTIFSKLVLRREGTRRFIFQIDIAPIRITRRRR